MKSSQRTGTSRQHRISEMPPSKAARSEHVCEFKQVGVSSGCSNTVSGLHSLTIAYFLSECVVRARRHIVHSLMTVAQGTVNV